MKTIEEKAKAYDVAIRKAKITLGCCNSASIITKHTIYDIFPELAESEDERIRKYLMERIISLYGENSSTPEGIKVKDIIDWLEKQGEKPKPSIRERYKRIANSEWFKKTHEGMSISDDEKVDNVNKIEPKFKVGDWVVSPNGVYWHIDAIQDGRYEVTADTGQCGNWPLDANIYRLWTIDDAKGGDVLVDENNNIGIYKEIEDIWWNSYIYLGCNNCLYGPSVGGIGGTHVQNSTKPATQEQRNLLFQKMHEAGYEWDVENKELKKIEQKPSCSDDKKLTDVNHEYFSELLENNDSEDINDYAHQVAYCMSHDWIEETATWDDVQKACKLGAEWKEKHWNNSLTAWSEEDELMFLSTIQGIEMTNGAAQLKIDWLKSLKERIGG